MQPPPGQVVRVPFGPQMLVGVVWDGEPDSSVPPAKLRSVAEVLPGPQLSPEVRRFVDWVARYLLCPPGLILRLVIRRGDYFDAPRPREALYAVSGADTIRTTPGRRAVLDALATHTGLSTAELAKIAGTSDAVVRGLINAGAIERRAEDPDAPFGLPDPGRPGRALTPLQDAAAAEIRARITAGTYSTTLLDGVTGSGKTEVYLEAIAAALAQDATAQVLVLLPEIALTLPFLQRLEDRFGAAPAHWHADVPPPARRRAFRRVADGSARLLVGARSALFLPWRNLRLIVVDEEHDGAYKAHDGILYQARDLAVARGALGNFPVILASATPSLETVANVEEGRYGRIGLPARFGSAGMPTATIIDLRQDTPPTGQWLAPSVQRDVAATVGRGEQVLLYLNRRGYAPVTLCRKCGERLTAPNSDTWLVEHRYTGRLVCHHTGYSIPKPTHCPHCGAAGSLVPCGPGVERVAEEARAHWPDARIEVFSSDTVAAPGAARALLARMTAGEIDILVATQAAAKGHNFPRLTLVVVVDADLGLAGGDLRAAERTFQTLSQVAGRAGRASLEGRVLLQSYQPHQGVIRALARADRDGFCAAELAGRAALGFPPYGRLAAVVLAAEDEARLTAAARLLASCVPAASGLEVWGPAPAPLYRLRGIYRQRFLVKTDRRLSIQAVLAAWLDGVKLPSNVRRTVDIDPYDFS